MASYNEDKLYERTINIYLESNPNPNSLKFVTNIMLVEEGKSFDFPNKESAGNAPLAEALFDFEEVQRVFYMNNFVTVTKSENVEWIEIQDKIKKFIVDWLEAEKPLLKEEAKADTPEIDEDEPEIHKKIKQILEEYVKPAVEQDGGAINFKDYHEGTVYVQLQGSCSGCPSSMVTLKAGIENLLTRMIPDIKGVEAEEI